MQPASGAQAQLCQGQNSGGLYFCRCDETSRLGSGGDSSCRARQLLGEESDRAQEKGGRNEGKEALHNTPVLSGNCTLNEE